MHFAPDARMNRRWRLAMRQKKWAARSAWYAGEHWRRLRALEETSFTLAPTREATCK